MADKKYSIDFTMSDGTIKSVEFTSPQGEQGVGISSIVKTNTNGLVDTYTITFTDGKTTAFTVTNGSDGRDGINGTNGKDGQDGTDGQTPYIKDGYWWIGNTNTNVKAEGTDGKDGTSVFIKNITRSQDGQIVEFSDGTSMTILDAENLYIEGRIETNESGGENRYEFSDGSVITIRNGERGVGIKSIEAIGGDREGSQYRITLDNGEIYDFYVENGTSGESVFIENTVESTESGGLNHIEFSDGTNITIRNGKDGDTYKLSEADKTEIASMIGGDVSVPDYWQSELETKADAIQVAMEEAGRNKSAFLWYTDAHWVNGNSKMSPKLLNYLYMNTPMNKVNFGGDIIGDTLLATREEMKYLYEWRKAIKDLPNHHSVFGNHDMFDLSSVDYEDDNYRYAFLLAPEESSDMVMGDGNYYYIDNPCEKTRYLYIAYFVGDGTAMLKQGQFICDAIKAVPEGWHIVAIAHRWWQYSKSATPTVGAISAYEAEMLSVFDAYNARETRSGSNYFYTQDFTEAKGKVEFCIGGHIHVDYDIESEGGIPVIITTSDTNQNRVPDSTVDCGTVGTITESAVYGIIADYNDPQNTKITVVGVGRGTSRVVRPSGIKPTSISNITYSGNTTIGSTIDKALFSFTVNYSNGTTDTVNGATSVSPATIGAVGNNTVTVTYTEGSTTLSGTATIVGTPVPVVNLLNLDRTYVTGPVGESIGKSYLDESKAYTNVVQGTNAFNASACTVSGVSEDGVTVKEAGIGGMSVVYPVYLPDISTNSYVLSFDYTGDGSSRVWYKYATANGVIDQNVTVCNKTGSGHIDYTIPSASGFAWLIIFVGANTGKTTTLSNVSLTKA